jgi:hypothetical protein
LGSIALPCLRAELEKGSVDADTTSWNWIHDGGNVVFLPPRWKPARQRNAR